MFLPIWITECASKTGFSFGDSSKKLRPHNSKGTSALKKDNRVSFGSFEEHWVVFVMKKDSWKTICRWCHLSPDKAWQSAQYNSCAWHIEKSKWGLNAKTKLGQYMQHLIGAPSDKSDPWLSFYHLKKSLWGAPLLLPFYTESPQSGWKCTSLSTEHILYKQILVCRDTDVSALVHLCTYIRACKKEFHIRLHN